MATKKKATKKQAVKKKAAKRKRGKKRFIVPGDAPILVGGGGSSYVWLKEAQGRRVVNPRSDDENTGVKPGAPTPSTRVDYEHCSRVNTNFAQIRFHDGVTMDAQGNRAEVILRIQNDRRWYVCIE